MRILRIIVTRKQRVYARMMRSIVEPVRSYWLSHDESRLAEAGQAMRVIVEGQQKSEPSTSASATIRISGWLPPQREFRLSARSLRLHNPGYHVSVRRFRRHDVVLPRLLKWWRTGFIVRAEGDEGLRPFAFGVSDRHGALIAMGPSNDDSRYAAKFLADVPAPAAAVTATGRSAIGYIDEVVFLETMELKNRLSWVSALAHLHPQEMLDLVDSAEGNFLARPIAESMGRFPANARWGDRFALSAGIADRATHSDLSLVKIVRPTSSVPRGGATVPEFKRIDQVARAVKGRNPIPSPSGEWLHLEGASVQDGGTVIVGDELVVYEAAADPTLDFVAGHYGRILGSRANPWQALVARRPAAEQTIDEGILLSGRNDANWYHWLIEYVPRVLQVGADIDGSVPVIVTSRTPQSGIEALRSLTARPITIVDADTSVSVELLHVTAPVVQVLDTTQVEWSSGLALNPQPLLAMREVLRGEAGEGTRKVFLQRSSRHRGMGNERAIERVAREQGLEIVNPGDLSWDEQRALFSRARLVVGASGAVMANYLLMPAGSRVLAMTSESLDGFVLPAAIAELAGVHFSYLLGPAIRNLEEFRHRRDWFHGDFEISVHDFEIALRNELRELN